MLTPQQTQNICTTFVQRRPDVDYIDRLVTILKTNKNAGGGGCLIINAHFVRL